MDKKLRTVQLQCLRVFTEKAKTFALAGGTALELYYLHHRFSADLDFFSPVYDLKEIGTLVRAFAKQVGPIKLESELTVAEKAKVRFYSLFAKGLSRPLKIDFVEDVLFDKPQVKKIKGVRVYSAKSIYLQKLVAICGLNPELDAIGREISRGRNAARDVFDLYWLSQKIEPLHRFLLRVSKTLQRGMVHWYRSFAREELKLALMDLDIYDKKFGPKAMVVYLEREIKKFIGEVIA